MSHTCMDNGCIILKAENLGLFIYLFVVFGLHTMLHVEIDQLIGNSS